MKARIAGMGCVTPLGSAPNEVLAAIAAGKTAEKAPVINPESGRGHVMAPVSPKLTTEVGRESRLRRSSAISLLAATAAKRAMEGITWTPEARARLAIVFGVASGGVQYTRRFYEQVVKQGANAASPMLFPETVYNAPASHVAALLQVDGPTYTLVGDGTVSLQAAAFGAELLAMGDADHVLVVGAEELDWILLEAHCDWRLTTDGNERGALLAEGAAAVLLTRDTGSVSLELGRGCTFVSHDEAANAMRQSLAEFSRHQPVDLLLNGGNGTWVDEVIHSAAIQEFPSITSVVTPKLHLGEALGAGALLEVVLAAESLIQGRATRALVAALGWNQQAMAAVLER